METGALKAGDTIMVIGAKCGMVKEQISKLVVNGKEKPEAVKGDKITFPFSFKVSATDKIYKVVAAVENA